MAVYYLDISALVKRYMIEQGSRWVRNITGPITGNRLYVVRLTGPQIVAALVRKARGGQIALRAARRAVNDFRLDWGQQYRIVELTATLTGNAMAIVEKHALRGYDAVHLAAALELHQDRQAMQLPVLTFVSADVEHLQAALAEGLVVESPDHYT